MSVCVRLLSKPHGTKSISPSVTRLILSPFSFKISSTLRCFPNQPRLSAMTWRASQPGHVIMTTPRSYAFLVKFLTARVLHLAHVNTMNRRGFDVVATPLAAGLDDACAAGGATRDLAGNLTGGSSDARLVKRRCVTCARIETACCRRGEGRSCDRRDVSILRRCMTRTYVER